MTTLAALRDAFPEARLIVADDHSDDATPEVARAAGAEVVRAPQPARQGRGEHARRPPPARRAGARRRSCSATATSGGSARQLPRLVEAVEDGRGELAVASFARRVGGGFGVALGFARWAIRRRTGLEPSAPISGQRALAPGLVPAVVPFAHGFGMEIGMTVDAAARGLPPHRGGPRPRAPRDGQTAAGFVHRFRQLLDFARVYAARR